MEKIERVRMPDYRQAQKPAKCVSCGEEGFYRVTFKDYWGKLTVTLCEECSNKQYEELKLQSRLDWPVIA